MKNLFVVLCLLTGLSVSAQRKLENKIAYNNEAVEMSFDLASAIEVRTWDKSEIKVQADITADDKEVEDQMELQMEKHGSSIKIKSNATELYKYYGDDKIVINQPAGHEFNYVVYVPKDVQMQISSITGDLNSNFLKGDIDVDLVTGDINIKKFEGDLKLKTITGEINLPAKNTSFKAETVMGQIYADASPGLTRKEGFIGKELSLDINESKNRLRLNTVTGDIDLQ